MKTFMVFLALLIMNTTFISYQGDLNKFIRLQNHLKNVAEEAAATTALYYDEEAYSYGKMIINTEEGNRYIEDLLEEERERLGIEQEDCLTADIIVIDHSDETTGLSPSVEVIIELKDTELFRLPFIKKDKVIRSGKYELAD